MKFAVDKVRGAGNDKIILTERGTTFGYQDLVVDYRNIPLMKDGGVPVVMDCTHSLQQPNQPGGITGGNPQLIGTIAKAAIAAGADGLILEVHPDPERAMSDGYQSMNFEQFKNTMKTCAKIANAIGKQFG